MCAIYEPFRNELGNTGIGGKYICGRRNTTDIGYTAGDYMRLTVSKDLE